MPNTAFSAQFREAFDNLLKARRDVRHFKPHPVSELLLSDLLAHTAIAPSVGLSQPWRFVRVDDAQRRRKVRDLFKRCNAAAEATLAQDDAADYARLKLAGLDDAPHHIAVFCDPDPAQGRGLGRTTMPSTVQWSVVIAIHNFWLSATAFGVGVGWVSILEPDSVRTILDVNPAWELIAYLCVGYPSKPSDEPELQEKGWAARDPARCAWIQR